MRAAFSIIGLLLALALVALLVRTQFSSLPVPQTAPVLAPSTPAATAPANPGAATSPAAVPAQIGQQVQELMQPRPMPDDAR